jgi:hypothetical protein
MTGIFLSVAGVLPDEYPLEGELLDYVEQEHGRPGARPSRPANPPA